MITLLTDFGTTDHFVPAVRGAVLSVCPQSTLIDITHEIPPYDIFSGAFTLSACFRDFPPGTVHLAIVDPGVGSSRRPIVVATDEHIFVGPDNGIFSFVYRQPLSFRVFHATQVKFFRESISPTFHGRDLFGPLAAYLDRGLDVAEVGPQIFDYQVLDLPTPQRDSRTGAINGEVIHVDRFGNCVTNLTAVELNPASIKVGTCFSLGLERVTHFGDHFAQAEGGGLVAYLGSSGYWEIGLWCSSAATSLDVRRGEKVVLEIGIPKRTDQ